MSHQQHPGNRVQQQQPQSEASYNHLLDHPMDSPKGNQDVTKHMPENDSESDDYYSRDGRDSVSRAPANITESLDGQNIDYCGRDSPYVIPRGHEAHEDDIDENNSIAAAREDQEGAGHEHSHERSQAATTPDSNLPRVPSPHAQGQDGQPAQLRCARCSRQLPLLEPALYQGQWLRSPSVSPRLPPPAAPRRHHHFDRACGSFFPREHQVMPPHAQATTTSLRSHRPHVDASCSDDGEYQQHHHHQQLIGPAITPGRERYDSRDVEGFVYSVPVVSAPLSSMSGYYHYPLTHAQGAAARGYCLVQEEGEDGPGALTDDGDGISLFYGPRRMVFRWHDPVVMMNNMGAYYQAMRPTTSQEEIAAGYHDDEYATSRYYHGAAPAELDSSSSSNLYFLPALDGFQIVH